MKLVFATLLTLMTFGSLAKAEQIQFSKTGKGQIHSGILLHTVTGLRDQLTHFLSNQMQCTSIDFRVSARAEGGFFNNNSIYRFQGSANCPSVKSADLQIKVDSFGTVNARLSMMTSTGKKVQDFYIEGLDGE